MKLFSHLLLLTPTILLAAGIDSPASGTSAPSRRQPSELSVFDCAGAYDLLSERIRDATSGFYVYRGADDGVNHGFPSGFFGSALDKIATDSACVDDSNAEKGCSNHPEALDTVRGTIMQIRFDSLTGDEFAGLNFDEPEGAPMTGKGYDLQGATELVFDARSPDGARVQFGMGGGAHAFQTLDSSWTEIHISLDQLMDPNGAGFEPDLANVHLLFTVVTNAENAPAGGTVLVDNIRYQPLPPAQTDPVSLPAGTETFGVVPRTIQPIPADQAISNLATTYESAIAMDVLRDRATPDDLGDLRSVADGLVYALDNDNSGAPLPTAPDGSAGLHDGYSSGDLSLFNDQGAEAGQEGEIRFAGFTIMGDLCSPVPGVETSFCLVLDGATGGNNAFAVLALLGAYETFDDAAYLEAAREIARWSLDVLKSEAGYGGYIIGYTDAGVRNLIQGKSVENNADVFASFMRLSKVEAGLGNTNAAQLWEDAAHHAGDFVMAMFDPAFGRFRVGTVPDGTPWSCGIDPSGVVLDGDVINNADFLDSNTFTTLALANSDRYRDQIDWRRPLQYVLATFAKNITAQGQTYQGFSLVPAPLCGPDRPDPGPDGIAWEFTGQVVVTARFVDSLYGESTFENTVQLYLDQLRLAQISAPHGDGRGLVAATLDDSTVVPLVNRCLNTPFQCIPERVGLAATVWGIAAERQLTFLPEPVSSLMRLSAVISLVLLSRLERPNPRDRASERQLEGSSCRPDE